MVMEGENFHLDMNWNDFHIFGEVGTEKEKVRLPEYADQERPLYNKVKKIGA